MSGNAARHDEAPKRRDPVTDGPGRNEPAAPTAAAPESPAALRQSLDLLEQIINRIGDPVFVKDEQRRYVLANDAHCRAVGKRREHLLGRSDDDFYPPKQAEAFAAQDELVLGTGRQSLIEGDVTDSRGAVHLYTARKALLVDGSGKKYLVGVARDVTEQKRSEQELRQEKLFTDAIIGSLPGYFHVLDCAGRYVRWNKAVEELTGLSPAQLAHTDARRFVHEEDRPLVAAQMRKVFEDGYAQAEVRVIDRQGAVRHLLLTGKRLDIGGAMFLVGTGMDVTERKLTGQAPQPMEDRAA